jgi:hypothetical protein
MSRSFSRGSQHLLFTAAASLLACLALAASARADVTVTDCSQLQSSLNEVKAGEVLTLAAMCEGGFVLPPKVAFTLEGKAGTTSGFDGSLGSPELLLDGNDVGNVTIQDLTFEHANGAGEGSALHLVATNSDATQLLLDHDSFSANKTTGGGAAGVWIDTGICSGRTSGSVSITNSLFEGNEVNPSTSSGEGSALLMKQDCNVISTTLAHNVFRANSVNVEGQDASGGAVFLSNESPELPTVTQAANLFESNSITQLGTAKSYFGGGEWTQGFQVTSTGDRFVGNSLPGAGASPASSEGGGLGSVNTDCNVSAMRMASTIAVDLVAAANKIGSSAGGTSEGAGVYAGCATGVGFEQLTLNDSTVAGNQAPGGISGVDGEESDQLALANSIVTSPPGQADIGGFRTASGGSLTSSFSDACEPDTSAAFPGEGDICADPRLPAAEAGDVHEAASSPTIDAGSNALVPTGLTTDAFGTTRILPGRAGCTGSFPAVVDMGAAEFQPGVPSCPPPILKTVPPRPPGLTHFVRLKTTAKGAALTLSCTSTDGLGCSGTIFITTDELLHGKKIVAISLEGRKKVSVRLAQTPFSIPAGGTATIQVKLNATGLKLLRRFHTFSTFLIANEASPTSDPFIFLFHTARFSEPKKKPKKHHPHRPKHPKHH